MPACQALCGTVVPAKAGTQFPRNKRGPRLRGGDSITFLKKLLGGALDGLDHRRVVLLGAAAGDAVLDQASGDGGDGGRDAACGGGAVDESQVLARLEAIEGRGEIVGLQGAALRLEKRRADRARGH